jgi:phage terminase small subunit
MTPRKQRFVAEYLVDLNGSAAAVRAGYSPRSAKQRAFELLQEPEIAAAVKLKTEKNLERVGMTVDEIMNGLAGLAREGERDSDKIRAYELLGKYHKLFVDKIEATGKDGEPISVVFNLSPAKESPRE